MRYKALFAAAALALGAVAFAPASIADDQQGQKIFIPNDTDPVSVPVPATLALFGLGAGLLLFRKRR